MWNKRRRKFLWSIGALGFLLWVAAYGAYSGSQSGMAAVPTFLADVKITDILLVIFSGLLYLATMATVEATRAMGKVAQRQEHHFRRSERAYVKMSHVTPDEGRALQLIPVFDAENRTTWSYFSIEMQIKNHGDTPAMITDLLLTYVVVPLGEAAPPASYVPEGQKFPGAFLVKDDHYNVIGKLTLATRESSQVKNGSAKLWLYGYVDYLDVFGQHHRAGYGRVYVDEYGNNLVYEPSPYNYDRPLDHATVVS